MATKKITLNEVKKLVMKTLNEDADSELKRVWGYDYSPEGLDADYQKAKREYKRQLENKLNQLDEEVQFLLGQVQECEEALTELKTIVDDGNYLLVDYRTMAEQFIEIVKKMRYELIDISIEESSPANSIKNVRTYFEKLKELKKKIESEVEYGTPSEDEGPVMSENEDSFSPEDFEKMGTKKIENPKQMEKYKSGLTRLFNVYKAYESYLEFPHMNIENIADFHDVSIDDIEAVIQNPKTIEAIKYLLQKNKYI